jgi:regulator of protease activity HflC (stomatin/prohibitin superfamily)
VPAGNVAVATLFGKVQDAPLASGLHFPVNPLLKFTTYDIRERTIREEGVGIPTQDQLTTAVDVSIQYRIDGKMTPQILKETGTDDQAIMVHLLPKLRSVLREQGKTVKRAEDFFLDQTQQNLQVKIFGELRDYLQPKGIIIEAVLLRDVRLPQAILVNVERKKQTEQEVERQKAELQRQEIEAQKQVVTAKAEREAATEEAAKKQVLADAQAYEITKINQAIANNPAYIQLEALKTLQAISKDPAAKLYFLDGNSPQPLPLMHLGEGGMPTPKK